MEFISLFQEVFCLVDWEPLVWMQSLSNSPSLLGTLVMLSREVPPGREWWRADTEGAVYYLQAVRRRDIYIKEMMSEFSEI